MTDSAAGYAVSVIVTGAVTVMLRTAVFVAPPPVAVMVTGETPAFAVDPAVNVTVLLVTDPVRVAGEKEAVTPVGRPLAVRVTAEVNPDPGVMDSGTLAEPPGDKAKDALEVLNVKDGAPIVRLSGSVFVSPPPEPVTSKL